MGGYLYIPRVVFEREIAVLPLNLYIEVIVLQRIAKVINYLIKRDIKTAVNNIWETAQESFI